MKLQYRYGAGIFIGALESIGIISALNRSILMDKPIYLGISFFIIIWAVASALSYFTLFTVIQKVLSTIPKKEGAISFSFLVLLGTLTFFIFPLLNRTPDFILLKILSIVGLIAFISMIYSILFAITLLWRPADHRDYPASIVTFCVCFFSFFAISMLYLLAYYPGVMSADSFDQWKQMETFKFSDWHPAFSTLLNWLVTRVWHSAAAIAVFHSLLFAAVLAWVIVELQRLKIKKMILYPIAAFCILNPVNGIMSITLWKDIPYSVALLLLSLLTMKIITSEGRWLLSWKNIAVLAATMIFCSLVRHNGVIPVGMTIVAILVYYRNYWKKWAVMTAITLAVVLVVKGPVYDSLKVSPTHPFQSLVNPIMQVAGIITGDGKLTDEEKNLINELLPLERWKDGYKKYSEVPLAGTKGFNMDFFKTKRKEFLSAWASMALRNPGLAIKAYLDRTAIVWRITNPADSQIYTNPRNISSNKLGFQMNSRLPGLKSIFDRILRVVSSRWGMIVFWKPATYMVILLLFGFAAMIRNGFRWSLMLIPAIGNTLGLLIVTTSDQPRYYYITLLMAPVMIAAAFYDKKMKDKKIL